MADFTVESFDYSTNTATFKWQGDDADEAVAQFIAAMDSAVDERVLPFHREGFILKTLADLLAGQSISLRLVGHHRITLTRTTNQ